MLKLKRKWGVSHIKYFPSLRRREYWCGFLPKMRKSKKHQLFFAQLRLLSVCQLSKADHLLPVHILEQKQKRNHFQSVYKQSRKVKSSWMLYECLRFTCEPIEETVRGRGGKLFADSLQALTIHLLTLFTLGTLKRNERTFKQREKNQKKQKLRILKRVSTVSGKKVCTSWIASTSGLLNCWCYVVCLLHCVLFY